MTKRGDPWFKFYPDDYLDGTRHLSLEQRGAYVDALALQYKYEKPINDDYRWLGYQMHISERKAKAIVEGLVLAKKLLRGDDGLYNPRASAELEDKAAIRRVNSESALARHRAHSESDADQGQTNFESNEKTQQKQQTHGCERTTESVPRTRALDTDREDREERKEYPQTPKGGSCDSDPILEKPKTTGRAVARMAFVEWQEFARAHRLPVPKDSTFDQFAKKILARMTEHAEGGGAEAMLAVWHLALVNFAKSKFLRGMEGGFTAEIKFLTRTENFAKLINGGYQANTSAADAKWGSSAAAISAVLWWQDPMKVAMVTDDQWREMIAKHTGPYWNVDELGPAPGSHKCVVPRHLIAEMKLDQAWDHNGMPRRIQ
jgi:uncharacterized protein YdaU (DUF1376 family)